jgi:hypothetical protein
MRPWESAPRPGVVGDTDSQDRMDQITDYGRGWLRKGERVGTAIAATGREIARLMGPYP